MDHKTVLNKMFANSCPVLDGEYVFSFHARGIRLFAIDLHCSFVYIVARTFATTEQNIEYEILYFDIVDHPSDDDMEKARAFAETV